MGQIVGSFGLKGWVKVKSFAESPDSLGVFPTWIVTTKEGAREMALAFQSRTAGIVTGLRERRRARS
jgi:16S rRNA processing protein RimM